MNTKNIEVSIEIKDVTDMYKYAKLQFEAFNKIEKRPDYNKGYQFNIDDPKDQMWFKQFIQMRFCEELAEAYEAKNNVQHFKEEITDAFNFLIAAYIMVGKDEEWFKEHSEDWLPFQGDTKATLMKYSDDHVAFMHRLQFKAHWLCNLLKNRPWTQSHFPVSKKEFAQRLEDLWHEWIEYLIWLEVSHEDVYDYFAKKYCVNMFRIRSGY